MGCSDQSIDESELLFIIHSIDVLQDLSDNDLGHDPKSASVISELLRTSVSLETLKLAG